MGSFFAGAHQPVTFETQLGWVLFPTASSCSNSLEPHPVEYCSSWGLGLPSFLGFDNFLLDFAVTEFDFWTACSAAIHVFVDGFTFSLGAVVVLAVGCCLHGIAFCVVAALFLILVGRIDIGWGTDREKLWSLFFLQNLESITIIFTIDKNLP